MLFDNNNSLFINTLNTIKNYIDTFPNMHLNICIIMCLLFFPNLFILPIFWLQKKLLKINIYILKNNDIYLF